MHRCFFCDRFLKKGKIIFGIWSQISKFKATLLSVHDEGYSRNVSCALNVISTFLLYAYVILGFKFIKKTRKLLYIYREYCMSKLYKVKILYI